MRRISMLTPQLAYMQDFEEQPVVPASCWKRLYSVHGSGLMEKKDVLDRLDLLGEWNDITCEFLHPLVSCLQGASVL